MKASLSFGAIWRVVAQSFTAGLVTLGWASAAAPLFGQVRPDVIWTNRAKFEIDVSSPFVFSPEGSLVAAPGDDQTIKLWRTADGHLLRCFGLEPGEDADTLAISPDGTLLASGGEGYRNSAPCFRLVLRRASDGTIEGEPVHDLAAVRSLAFSPDGALLASGGWESIVRVWQVAGGLTLLTNLIGHTMGITCVAFSPDGTLLASGSADASIKIWRVSDWMLSRSLPGPSRYIGVRSLAFSPDSAFLASAASGLNPPPPGGGYYSEGAVKLWRVADGTTVWSRTNYVGYKSLAFSPDGTSILASGPSSNPLFFLAAHDGAEYFGYRILELSDDPDAPRGNAYYVGFAPSGQTFGFSFSPGSLLVLARTPLWISEFSRTNSTNTVRWSGGTGLYQLQQTTNVAGGPWQNVGGVTTNTNATVPATRTNTFFRVQSLTNAP